MLRDLKVLFINYHHKKDNIIKELLNLNFYSLDITYNFIDTLNILKINKYDLIISDFVLEDNKILELLERIKKNPNCLNIPIILIRENENNIIINKILNTIGNYEVISLPLQPEKILNIFEKFNNKKLS